MGSVWVLKTKYNSRTKYFFWNAKNTHLHIETKHIVFNLTTEFKNYINKKCLLTKKFYYK
uniref:MOY n=1 Tax=Zeugodacus cucurbitae TaxID=28588 RepID=A0A5B8GQA6_ZEUCU|nr:MOY [Zeugodacus cucurbitae]